MSLDLSILNPEQRRAVEDIEGPCMIIAGAGSGKTRVLTYKIAYLINSGVSPYEILSLTFTNKAASEMRARISELIPGSGEKLWMGTFHSIFARMLRMEADKIGFTRNFTIYDTEESLSTVKQIMVSKGISIENPTPKAVHSAISSLKNKMIMPSEASKGSRTYFEMIVTDVYEQYQKSLLKNNAMDFDDLLLKPIELFEKFPEILEKYQERFKFILVDEYQDTNKAQYYIIQLLSKKYRNISIVGDDAQSIYKWRGAEIQNIFDFQSDYPDFKIYRLEQNYRSTKKILSLADDIIKKNKKQIEKTLWTDNTEGDSLKLIENMTDRDESMRIVKIIHDEMHKYKRNYKDFVVVYRTNAQSRTIEDGLRQNYIPYIIVGGTRFYQRKEIKDVLSHLKIIVNPSDNESLLRVLSLKEGIGKTSLDRITAHAEKNNVQVFDVIKGIDKYNDFNSRIKNLLISVVNFIYKYQYLKEEVSLSELARGVIDEIGILTKYRLENTAEAEERMLNIQELINAIAEYADTTDEASIESFLQEVSLVADIDSIDDKKNAVTLMTIHASKGLEFPVVFIAGLEEGIFPGSNAIMSEEELEEERRLFYVAVTRAKEKLFMLYANQRYKFGMQSYQMKSRFIKEITPEIMESSIEHESLRLTGTKRSPSDVSFRQADVKAIRYDYYKPLSGTKRTVEEPENDKFPDIKKGTQVFHNTFGKGVVMGTEGKGLDKRAEIYFDDVGLKKIVLKYAKMRVEEHE